MTTHSEFPAAAKQEIESLKSQLAQAQKMTALGELLGTTTHEFNNILMTIINYAKMGIRHRDQETRDKALNKILAAGQRAAKITHSVLGMARNRSDAYEPTDLAELIQQTMILLEREMSKFRISVEQEYEEVPQVRANGNQIQQVLLNMLINARQAMSNGGRIIVRLKNDPSTGMVDLIIRDFGPGIEAERLSQIFKPYYSTKQGPDETGKGGTGLGLAACREIIEAHQGRIRVESTPGRGTAFTIKLPAANAPSPPSANHLKRPSQASPASRAEANSTPAAPTSS